MTLVIFSSFICRGLDMHSPANLMQVSGLMFEVHSSSTENGLQPGLWYSCSGFSVIWEPQNKFHLPLLYWSVGEKKLLQKNVPLKLRKWKENPTLSAYASFLISMFFGVFASQTVKRVLITDLLEGAEIVVGAILYIGATWDSFTMAARQGSLIPLKVSWILQSQDICCY